MTLRPNGIVGSVHGNVAMADSRQGGSDLRTSRKVGKVVISLQAVDSVLCLAKIPQRPTITVVFVASLWQPI